MPTKETTPEEISPSRYLEKVSLATGEVLDEEILPKQLLVHNHRDYHIVDFQARQLMGSIVRRTGDEEKAQRVMKEIRRVGLRATDALAKVIGKHNAETVSKTLLGLKRKEYYFRYKKFPFSKEETEARLAKLREDAHRQQAAAVQDGHPACRVLLTGGTGFVGQEIMWQAAHDEAVAEMVVLIRPKNIIDRKTKQVIGVLSPAERGEKLLDQLCLNTPEQRAKFRFIGGDVEQPQFGVSKQDIAILKKTITHLIHCAASVSFEDPYEVAYQINVKGTLNALDFSLSLQSAPKSPFIAHIGIETSYIHGRQMRQLAREDEMVFPRNFYNNYYELTKAMGSLDTDRYMLEKGLRVIQLCPAIVIGALKTGNNRGDTKVVNAPINLFGRAKQALSEQKGGYIERTMAGALAKMASVFPGDPTAQLNLIPVDWVVNGIIAALTRPDAVGERIHLATDNRIKSQDLRQIVSEELDVEIRLAEPTLHRTVTLPVLAKVLKTLKQEKVANGLERLSTIFSPYNEWGQPTHEVGKDARILGLPETRPKTTDAFRMLCRHNRYVQDYGQVWDVHEIARRETVWSEFIDNLEKSSGTPVADISAEDFRTAIQEHLDLESFTLK